MFDTDEAGLLAEMADAQRAERVAVARRLLAAGRLCQRRIGGLDGDDRTQWCIDNWEAVAAEVGAELGISRGRASTQMQHGVQLLERLPLLAGVFAAGEVDFRVVAVVLFRTALITDADLLAAIDAQLARCAPGWNHLSRKRVVECVDWRVRALDPAAERVARQRAEDRHVEIGPGRDGLAELWGVMAAPDAAVLDRRLEALAATVCRQDSRTLRQRRADALGALAAGAESMVCDCGSPDCPAAGRSASAGSVVIHLLAEASTLAGSGESPGFLPGFGAIPAAMVRGLAGAGARVKPLTPPLLLRTETGYRPSIALAEFVRWRDLCCRFPGCDKPAEVCDLDHTLAWEAGGPTHPSNIKLLCRPHHLLKTFWNQAENGWRDRQFADGTVEWTSPSGRVYTTTPGGMLFIPALATPTEILPPPSRPARPRPGRTLMMPTRRCSRAAERAARIQWERGLNEARWAADPPPY